MSLSTTGELPNHEVISQRILSLTYTCLTTVLWWSLWQPGRLRAVVSFDGPRGRSSSRHAHTHIHTLFMGVGPSRTHRDYRIRAMCVVVVGELSREQLFRWHVLSETYRLAAAVARHCDLVSSAENETCFLTRFSWRFWCITVDKIVPIAIRTHTLNFFLSASFHLFFWVLYFCSKTSFNFIRMVTLYKISFIVGMRLQVQIGIECIVVPCSEDETVNTVGRQK